MVRKEKSQKASASGEPVLFVTAQQSRFHTEAEENVASREVGAIINLEPDAF